MENEELAQEYVENLLELLTNSAKEMSNIETLDEVVLLLNEYAEDTKIEEQKEKEHKLLNEANDEEEHENPDSASFNPNINRGFILDKATKNYFKANELTLESFEELAPVEKTKHRKGISELFNNMVIEASNKPAKVSNLTSTPFKTKIKRDTSEDKSETELNAEKKWYNDQIFALKQKIRFCDVEIEELERQNNLKNVSGLIVTRNDDRIEELRQEKFEYEKDLKNYQDKL